MDGLKLKLIKEGNGQLVLERVGKTLKNTFSDLYKVYTVSRIYLYNRVVLVVEAVDENCWEVSLSKQVDQYL